MTKKTQDIRPRGNDTIDVEFHRADATSMRNQAIWDLMRGAKLSMWALVAGGMLLVAMIALAPRTQMTATAQAGAHTVAVVPQLR